MLPVIVFAAALTQPSDLVIQDARIWSDGQVGFAEFAAVRDGKFTYVGRYQEKLIGPKTQVIKGDGRIVLPGLIDSHIHMLSGGKLLTQLQLREARDKKEFIQRVKEWSDKQPRGKWILGGRWSTESWTTTNTASTTQPAAIEQPTKAWIDPITAGHPAFLPRMDGHSALVNSAALQVAGITHDGPPDPVGGVIDRDPTTREPTGILRESAMDIVARHIPATTIEDKLTALRRAMTEANSHGLTAVSDIPGINDLPAYEQLAAGELSVRFFLYPTATDWSKASDAVRQFKGKPGWVEIKGFKQYIDGSLGSRTAYMREPYLNNEPGREHWRGLLQEGVEKGRVVPNVAVAYKMKLQPIAHAIGDEANHILLNAYVNAYPIVAPSSPATTSPVTRTHLPEWLNLSGARCRIEHAQHLLSEDIQRIARLGVIASMQPYHKADDGRYAESYIGPQRSRTSYAFKSLLDAGAIVAFGSDWPVVTLDPFLGIEAAVTGRTLDGKFWQTQENLTIAEALRCYTSRGAYAAFAEDQIGSIAAGFRADFVVLDTPLFVDKPDWSTIHPQAVYVEGRRVFPAP